MDKAEIKTVYVLHGGDGYLVDAARREVVAAVIGQADPQTSLASFDGDAELSAVLDEMRTMPFLAPRRLVIVRDAEAFVAAHREALEKFLDSPPSHSSLVLMVSSWPSSTRLAKLTAKIGKVYDCTAPKGDNLGTWISSQAGKRGKKITPAAAELLQEWLNRDMGMLENEIEKLSLYVGKRTTIEEADLAAVVTSAAGPIAFELSNALTDGNAKAALAALDKSLAARGDEFKALGSIAWHVRRVLAAQEQVKSGAAADQALPRMPYQQRQAFMGLLKRRPLSKMRSDVRRLLRADLAMKSGGDATAVLQELVIGLCT